MEIPIAVIPVESIVFVGEVGDVERWAAGVEIVADGDTHRALLRAVLTDGGPGFQPYLSEFSIAFVPIQEVRRGIIGYVNVGATCVVEVGPHHTEPVIAV